MYVCIHIYLCKYRFINFHISIWYKSSKNVFFSMLKTKFHLFTQKMKISISYAYKMLYLFVNRWMVFSLRFNFLVWSIGINRLCLTFINPCLSARNCQSLAEDPMVQRHWFTPIGTAVQQSSPQFPKVNVNKALQRRGKLHIRSLILDLCVCVYKDQE